MLSAALLSMKGWALNLDMVLLDIILYKPETKVTDGGSSNQPGVLVLSVAASSIPPLQDVNCKYISFLSYLPLPPSHSNPVSLPAAPSPSPLLLPCSPVSLSSSPSLQPRLPLLFSFPPASTPSPLPLPFTLAERTPELQSRPNITHAVFICEKDMLSSASTLDGSSC